jgi:hypothetical protein
VDQELSQIEDAPVEQPPVSEPSTPAPSNGAAEAPQAEAVPERKQDPWKTAFIVLIGVVMLSAVLIYSTSSKRTEPTTVLQTDANGQPVQPLNPATGIEEERLASLPPDTANVNANVSTMPGQLPGGDGYDPWANGGKPPAGAPIGPGGGYVTIPNGGGSQFMPPECILQPSGIYLCPVPTNTNAAAKPSPTPRGSANANVQPSPTPATGASPKPTATPPGAKPSPTPRTRNTPTPNKPNPSPELDQLSRDFDRF